MKWIQMLCNVLAVIIVGVALWMAARGTERHAAALSVADVGVMALDSGRCGSKADVKLMEVRQRWLK